jgi:hypothetical protein
LGSSRPCVSALPPSAGGIQQLPPMSSGEATSTPCSGKGKETL